MQVTSNISLDQYFARLEEFGVNLKDKGLVSMCRDYFANNKIVAVDALSALEEAAKRGRVHNENAYLKKALREHWKPCFTVRR
jgi:hypothetical protein